MVDNMLHLLCIRIAFIASEGAVGCVALRNLGDGVLCEIKRMFVGPAARGAGCGRLLPNEIIAQAQKRDYGSMRLDTLERPK